MARAAGCPITLDEAKAVFRAGGGRRPSTVRPAESRSASAFAEKSGREMLTVSLSVDDPEPISPQPKSRNAKSTSLPRRGVLSL